MADGTCLVDGCGQPVYVKVHGLCTTHYHRWRRTGDPNGPLQRHPNEGTCSVDGCDQPMRKRGWCAAHYAQQYRSGEPPQPFRYKWADEPACIVCGSTNMAWRSRKFCSGRCQMLESRARRGEFPDAIRPSKPCALCGVTIDLFAPGRDRNRKPTNRKRRADSAMCADCRRQKGHRHRWSVQALAARDGIGCRICGQAVDMGLRGFDPMAPSVDHIVARADGGSDDPSNLQLAHLTCNHRKSRRSGWTMT